MDTHGPYEPPGEYATLYSDQDLSDRDAQSLYQRAIDNPESITETEQQLLIDLYDAEIRYNDEYIGTFLNELRERGLLERSLLIVTADHGDAFGENGYYEHPRYLHDEIIKIPLVVRSPNRRDEVVKTPVSTLDVGATIESAVGVAAAGEGVSLLGTLPADRTVFCQARGEDEHSHLRRYASRSAGGACFCERDRELGRIKFGEYTDFTLCEEVESHINERIRIDNGEPVNNKGEVNEEIERRLDALGYK